MAPVHQREPVPSATTTASPSTYITATLGSKEHRTLLPLLPFPAIRAAASSMSQASDFTTSPVEPFLSGPDFSESSTFYTSTIPGPHSSAIQETLALGAAIRKNFSNVANHDKLPFYFSDGKTYTQENKLSLLDPLVLGYNFSLIHCSAPMMHDVDSLSRQPSS
jgi:hypothetical protein